MSGEDLKDLLEHVEDTREIVLRPAAPEAWRADELLIVWRAAREEANDALDEWRRRPGTESYVVYRAAEDRADAAVEALAAEAVTATSDGSA